MQPLEGIRIADFSHVMAGPFASHLLRLMGAEVIKVESPERGDAMRFYGFDRRYDGMSPAFIGVNTGKKSVALNLKKPAALAAAKKLVETADVVLENFRPGVITRLGLGYDACRELNPGIVYCSVSGYGQSGPMRDWPAIDNIVQATSGMMSLSGETDGEWMRVGFPVVDTITGQSAAFRYFGRLVPSSENRGGGIHRCGDAGCESGIHDLGRCAVSGDRRDHAPYRKYRLQRAAHHRLVYYRRRTQGLPGSCPATPV